MIRLEALKHNAHSHAWRERHHPSHRRLELCPDRKRVSGISIHATHAYYVGKIGVLRAHRNGQAPQSLYEVESRELVSGASDRDWYRIGSLHRRLVMLRHHCIAALITFLTLLKPLKARLYRICDRNDRPPPSLSSTTCRYGCNLRRSLRVAFK